MNLFTLDEILAEAEKIIGRAVNKTSSYRVLYNIKITPDKVGGARNNTFYYSEQKKNLIVKYYQLYYQRREARRVLLKYCNEVKWHLKECRKVSENEENKRR